MAVKALETLLEQQRSSMSATTSPGVSATSGESSRSPSSPRFRIGRTSSGAADEWAVEWKLKRNCSMAPRQLFGFFLGLCALSLAVAAFFWWFGAAMVMSFAWIELLAVGAALLVYARHATDNESIALRGDRLTVEHVSGGRLERVEFQSQWVRVEYGAGDAGRVELSGQGCRIEVGRYLRPALRRQLAGELLVALRHSAAGPARRGPANEISKLK